MATGVNWIQIAVQAALGIVAAAIGIRAWLTSVEALHTAYRPVLRAVPIEVSATRKIHPAELLLKNIGRGPAVGVMVFDYEEGAGAPVMAERDVIEPLGPRGAGGEAGRVGRAHIVFDQGHWLESGKTYRILYQ